MSHYGQVTALCPRIIAVVHQIETELYMHGIGGGSGVGGRRVQVGGPHSANINKASKLLIVQLPSYALKIPDNSI